MSAIGIIFSSIHNETIEELTRKRTSASIPFGGRYRLIDFALSNFVNADISTVGVLTQKNYQSLIDHLGSGRDWDLARKNGGLIIFPPYSSHYNDFLYENRFEALKSVSGFIAKSKADLVVLTDSDSVNHIEFEDVMRFHREKNADITIVTKKIKVANDFERHMSVVLDDDRRVVKASAHSKIGSTSVVSLNVWVINRSLLDALIQDANISGTSSFTKDVIIGNVKSLKIYAYDYQGLFFKMNTMENYFKANMLLLNEDVREELFGNPHYQIYTKVRDSAPTRYAKDAKVVNSFIADGCEIQGTVENSILFRGVKIGEGSVVRNCILMQDSVVGSNCTLDFVITDKNVTIMEKKTLAGCESIPYYLSKGLSVK